MLQVRKRGQLVRTLARCRLRVLLMYQLTSEGNVEPYSLTTDVLLHLSYVRLPLQRVLTADGTCSSSSEGLVARSTLIEAKRAIQKSLLQSVVQNHAFPRTSPFRKQNSIFSIVFPRRNNA